jgi:hypothetical protein
MGEQTFDRTKKTIAIFTAILFVVTLTAASASAADGRGWDRDWDHGWDHDWDHGWDHGWGHGHDWWWGHGHGWWGHGQGWWGHGRGW